MLGFAYLGKAGIAPFALAKALIIEDGDEQADSGDKASSGGTSDVLSGVASVLGVSDADILKLGDLNSSTNSSLPLLVPYCANRARASLESIEIMNKAIEVVCPFVSSGVKLSEDARHACEPTDLASNFQGKANFLWAFAHLSEAIAFDKVVKYSTTDSEQTNLELRMEAIDGRQVTNSTEIASFIAEVDSLNQAISKILPSVDV